MGSGLHKKNKLYLPSQPAVGFNAPWTSSGP